MNLDKNCRLISDDHNFILQRKRKRAKHSTQIERIGERCVTMWGKAR